MDHMLNLPENAIGNPKLIFPACYPDGVLLRVHGEDLSSLIILADIS